MKEHYIDFPYEEIRNKSGDYFDYASDLTDLGYTDSQIWSVIEVDSNAPNVDYVIITGPSYHYVNRIGYFATEEAHDGETYYVDEITLAH